MKVSFDFWQKGRMGGKGEGREGEWMAKRQGPPEDAEKSPDAR